MKHIILSLVLLFLFFAAKSQWGLTGNSATNPALNFVGTSDNKDLVFRTNNVERVRISQTGRLLVNGNGNNLLIGATSGNGL